MSLSYHIPSTTVKTLVKSALTTADRNRLKAADAYYAQAGQGRWTFAQTCSDPACPGFWLVTISESDPQFRSAIDRAISGGLCKACEAESTPGVKSLIQWQSKSTSAGANSSSGKGAHRHQASAPRTRKPTAFEQARARLEAAGYILVKSGKRRYAIMVGNTIISVVGSIGAALGYLPQPGKAVGR